MHGGGGLVACLLNLGDDVIMQDDDIYAVMQKSIAGALNVHSLNAERSTT